MTPFSRSASAMSRLVTEPYSLFSSPTARAIDTRTFDSESASACAALAILAVRAAITRFSCSTRLMSPAVALTACPRGNR